MKTLVVLFALASMACGSLVPVAQPLHHAALVLDPHGRPLDTAEVINARAVHLQAKALEGHEAHIVHAAVAPVAHSIVAPTIITAPAAVSHQSRVDVHSSPAIWSHAIGSPVVAHAALASPLLAHSATGWSGHEHLLKKRSVGHLAVIAPAAVSHQSRLDVISSPEVVSHSVATPLVAHSVSAPVIAVAPAAVSHQSRVDVHSSPAIWSHAIGSPVVAHAAIASPLLAHSATGWAGHEHLLKKRSLGHLAVIAPAAVSHQSRLEVHSSPAIWSHAVASPVVAHAALASPLLAHSAIGWAGYKHLLKKRSLGHLAVIAPAAVSHQSRLDVISSPAVVSHAVATPLVTHAVVAPLAHTLLEAPAYAAHGNLALSNGHLLKESAGILKALW